MVLKSPNAGEKGPCCCNTPIPSRCWPGGSTCNRLLPDTIWSSSPDWSGYCDPTLSYCQFPFPVFVQAFERADAELITAFGQTSWSFHPRPTGGSRRDCSGRSLGSPGCRCGNGRGWGEYKRHHRFFRALGRPEDGPPPARALARHPISFTRQDVLTAGAYHGVGRPTRDPRVGPYEQVNDSRKPGKVNVIWSRRKGSPGIIEGMFAGCVCCPEGFNYGYRYPYINPQTGCFVSERSCPKSCCG